MRKHHRILACIATAILATSLANAEDWPTYRHDNARSARTTETIAPSLHQQWVFVPPYAPEPAWTEPAKEKPRVRFDEVYHVAAVGDAVYWGSSADNKVYCLDAATGQVRWSTPTNGPIRVAPTVANSRVYVGSDDGFAYCLNATDGAVVWKTRAAFSDQKVLGNGDMISMWPVRTGVLLDGDIAYFGAGVFPHESIFICAVNAADGSIIWRNDTVGEIGYTLEFGGISPQGALLASKDALFIPSARAMPAAFNKADGAFSYFLSPGGKVGGTWALLTEDRLVAGIEAKRNYDIARGKMTQDAAYAWFPGVQLVIDEKHAYMLNFEELVALDRKAFGAAAEWRNRVTTEHRALGKQVDALKAEKAKASEDRLDVIRVELETLYEEMKQLDQEQKRIEAAVHRWRGPCKQQDAMILAGDVLYVGGDGSVAAALARTGQWKWRAPVDGRACGLAAANDRLFVSSDNGNIYSFGNQPTDAEEITISLAPAPYPEDEQSTLFADAAERIVNDTGVTTKGFCLVYGSGTGRLTYELAKRTDLKFVCIEDDPAQVAQSIAALEAAGLYGKRVTVDHGSLLKLPYADYFANLIVSEAMLLSGQPEGNALEVLRCLKPCGGIVALNIASEDVNVVGLDEWVLDNNCAVEEAEGWVKLTRGPLPGAGKWTHLYADAANTACSDDQVVKGPLGVLWFGEPGPERMVERHARAAAPAAIDGRMFVQGENVIMAYDSYNGQLLWTREVPGALRVRVDSDMSNLALQSDGLYVATESKCLRLDPATGETVREYELPNSDTDGAKRWGYIAAVDDLLYGTIAPELAEPYGRMWEQLIDEDGAWRTPADWDMSEEEQRYLNQYQSRYEEPNTRAFWEAQQGGFMWRRISPWPAWGSVATPEGAVTERIMAGDAFFAVDTETGSLKWRYDGKAIAHPAIAIGDGLVFVADCNVTDEQKQAAMAERESLIAKGTWHKAKTGYKPEDADVRLVVALDAVTGEKRWERVIDLTGCGGDRLGLAYSKGILCFFGCFSNHDRGLFKEGRLEWRRITTLKGSDGADMWSKPLDYLRRPVIVGDTILIEPRMCSLQTGEIITRKHPLTGLDSTWEYVRPGHCCSVTSASPNMFFLRGYFLWYYDLLRDQGMQPFGAIRPGCWINVIPANGLLLFPEASAGCTCSYPVRSTVVLKPKAEQTSWAFAVQHGPMKPVKRMAVNFGAPGDWRDEDGTMWLCYPHVRSTSWQTYGLDFKLEEQFIGDPKYFAVNFKGASIEGTDKPWLLASGAKGLTRCTLPLLDEAQAPAAYTVRLYFAETDNTGPGQRVFDIKLQEKPVLKGFDIVAEAGGTNRAIVKEFKGIEVNDNLLVELIPEEKEPTPVQGPVLNGIEVIRENVELAQAR